MGLDTGGGRMPESLTPVQAADLARRALRWMMEHRVYYCPRQRTLLEPVSLTGRQPITLPPPDVAVYLFELTREIELEAEHAS